eukprot:CAMPEP_0113684134 /NCGR_PEP_ID=MMETSP0038_2-20120614/13788_1 /TAXON_ID=2898 /ORGANISM="Cryptomonas paramecium" /LENGTH=130 /DNA_ID=CAMNT_0000603757 /DNA_START=796 /DNA_END=1188 /DNA_ORIENTATION=+ /assembly_acc=CAM_ASM_000170
MKGDIGPINPAPPTPAVLMPDGGVKHQVAHIPRLKLRMRFGCTHLLVYWAGADAPGGTRDCGDALAATSSAQWASPFPACSHPPRPFTVDHPSLPLPLASLSPRRPPSPLASTRRAAASPTGASGGQTHL